ncbi:uncharacterized protein BDR25DRAFT_302595 [Lindgomyces ingoldianus]|uniref:Uncharacterized protein n=1 Tax=Lindgomyces ingoldianus TaxID=673940 RepID=A0ACB6QZ99_9PLEO|nr:uncharacterized protein BDR25DRAFT_302595 [Lindgomyces ingoldianus]KAF2472374.1 hypothetical protein BDR25DRAFT_302595 [Lindgomyces ingoldianus]
MPSLLDLSAELKLTVVKHLGSERNNDILSISRTCQVLRELVAPSLFKNIVLRNNEKSGNSVKEIRSGSYKDFVRAIHYEGMIRVLDGWTLHNADDQAEEPKEEHFPKCVEDILSNLSRFPKLEKLVVEFPCDDDDLARGFYNFDEEESYEQAVEVESEEAWRALMAKSYEAVGRNSQHSIKTLELRGLVARQASSWNGQGFRNFLGGMESFIISIKGGNNDVGWCVNTLQGYLEFITHLGNHFFDHLTNVTSFSFTATDEGPPGLEGLRHVPLPLLAHHMPHLQTLELGWIFINPQLLEFINSHHETLISIRLEHTFSGASCRLAENGITWAEFFNSIHRAGPSKLKRLEILPLESRLKEDEEDESMSPEAERVQSALDQNPEKRLFSYAGLSSKYGMLFEYEENNIEQFERGEDQRGYDRLMSLIKTNI